tara:strand:- start:255 stop:854 length:600 start_codon:yes stop_codon:yes gene_type:complete
MSYNTQSYTNLLNKSIKSQQELIKIQKQNIQLKEQVNKLESSISRFRTNNIRMSKQNTVLKASKARLEKSVKKLKEIPAEEEYKVKMKRLQEKVKYWKGNRKQLECRIAHLDSWIHKHGFGWFANNDKAPEPVEGDLIELLDKEKPDQNLLKVLTDEKLKVINQVEKITKLRRIIIKLVKRIEEHKLMDQDATQAILNI